MCAERGLSICTPPPPRQPRRVSLPLDALLNPFNAQLRERHKNSDTINDVRSLHWLALRMFAVDAGFDSASDED
jgi:hypothetical protein